jgi:hypothetical protein
MNQRKLKPWMRLGQVFIWTAISVGWRHVGCRPAPVRQLRSPSVAIPPIRTSWSPKSMTPLGFDAARWQTGGCHLGRQGRACAVLRM